MSGIFKIVVPHRREVTMTNVERTHTEEEIPWLAKKIYGDIPPKHLLQFMRLLKHSPEALLDEISSKVKALGTLFVLEQQSILYLTTNPEDDTAHLSYAEEIVAYLKENGCVMH